MMTYEIRHSCEWSNQAGAELGPAQPQLVGLYFHIMQVMEYVIQTSSKEVGPTPESNSILKSIFNPLKKYL